MRSPSPAPCGAQWPWDPQLLADLVHLRDAGAALEWPWPERSAQQGTASAPNLTVRPASREEA